MGIILTVWQSPVVFTTTTLGFIFKHLEELNLIFTGINRLSFLITICGKL